MWTFFLNRIEVKCMQNGRILIIDGDESVRKVMQTIFEDEATALKQRKQLKKA